MPGAEALTDTVSSLAGMLRFSGVHRGRHVTTKPRLDGNAPGLTDCERLCS